MVSVLKRVLTVTTPENVVLALQLAGAGSRFIAALLDGMLEMAILVVIGAMIAFVGWSLGKLGVDMGAYTTLAVAVGLVAAFMLLAGYFVFFESRWNGQTPGKRVMGLRVIRDGGLPIDFPAALLRNLCRAADFLPALYGVGLLSILVSREYKRLGDYVAGTLVVEEGEGMAPPAAGHPPGRAEYVLLGDSALRRLPLLTRKQYEAARRYIERSGELQKNVAEQLGQKIAGSIAEVLQEQEPTGQSGRYLQEVVAAYEERVLRRPRVG